MQYSFIYFICQGTEVTYHDMHHLYWMLMTKINNNKNLK